MHQENTSAHLNEVKIAGGVALLHRIPEDGQKGPLGDLWRPWGSNFEVTGFAVAIWVGSQIKYSGIPTNIPPVEIIGTCLITLLAYSDLT